MDYPTEIAKAKELLMNGHYNLCSMQCGKIMESALKLLLSKFLIKADETEIRTIKQHLSSCKKDSFQHMMLGELCSLFEKSKVIKKSQDYFRLGKEGIRLIDLKNMVAIRNRATHDSLKDVESEAGAEAHIIYGSLLKLINWLEPINVKDSTAPKTVKKKVVPIKAKPFKVNDEVVKKPRAVIISSEQVPSSNRSITPRRQISRDSLIESSPQDSILFCKHKTAKKNIFLYIDDLNKFYRETKGQGQFITPQDTIRFLNIDSFEEPEEQTEEYLLKNNLITKKQAELYRDYNTEKPTSKKRKIIREPQLTAKKTKYIESYRKQLDNPNTLPSKIKKFIREKGEVPSGELKRACVELFGCTNEKSGSINASLRVLEVDGYIRRDGRGDYQSIIWLGE